jgi:hypothetical protein
MNIVSKPVRLTLFPALIALAIFAVPAVAQQPASAASKYFTIESYYRVKWGYADEFIRLWKTNHYPLLKKAEEKGVVVALGHRDRRAGSLM